MMDPKNTTKTENELPETVPTVPGEPETELAEEKADEGPPPSREPHIEMAEDDTGEWRWCLFASNGRPMAASIIGFKRRNDCQKNAENAIDLFKTPKLRILAHVKG